jgi:hypothetical protein
LPDKLYFAQLNFRISQILILKKLFI